MLSGEQMRIIRAALKLLCSYPDARALESTVRSIGRVLTESGALTYAEADIGLPDSHFDAWGPFPAPRLDCFRCAARAIHEGGSGARLSKTIARDGSLQSIAWRSNGTGQIIKFFRVGDRWHFRAEEARQDSRVSDEPPVYSAGVGLRPWQQLEVRRALGQFTTYSKPDELDGICASIGGLLEGSGQLTSRSADMGIRSYRITDARHGERFFKRLSQIICGGDVSEWAREEVPTGWGALDGFRWVSPSLGMGFRAFRCFDQDDHVRWHLSIEPWPGSSTSADGRTGASAQSRRGIEGALDQFTTLCSSRRERVVSAIERVLRDVRFGGWAFECMPLGAHDVPNGYALARALAAAVCGDDGDVSSWHEWRHWGDDGQPHGYRWVSRALGLSYVIERNLGGKWCFTANRLTDSDFEDDPSAAPPTMVPGPRFTVTA